MKSRILLVSLVLALAGCASSPADRIEKDRAAFDGWPSDVQAKIKAGEVAVGFTPAQVRMAAGDPDRIFTQTTAQGTEEVWSYRSSKPRFSLGLGVGGGGGGTFVGGSTVVSSGGHHPDEVLRVVFAGGVVAAVEKLQ
jgi:hypothetical protein